VAEQKYWRHRQEVTTPVDGPKAAELLVSKRIIKQTSVAERSNTNIARSCLRKAMW
jgi:hypothetical protein